MHLGLDLSTQSLTAVVVADRRARTVASVNFDADVPAFGTSGGVLRGPGEGQVSAPPAMWAAALELLFERLAAAPDVDLGAVRGVCGSGQQHGSVFWREFPAALDPGRPLAEQVAAALARPSAPVWQDSSTRAQCEALEAAAGGAQALAERTGSVACERFTGPQIMKVAQTEPEAYAATTRISLVSSFLASLLLGAVAPIDASDASGMNLMDLRTRRWDAELLAACAPGLAARLGPEPCAPGAPLGAVARFWTERFGLAADCAVAACSGDNPCSLAGLRLPPRALAVSLGTSDTLMGSTREPQPGPVGHVFAHPTRADEAMVMLCYADGSLAREAVRGADKSWDDFAAALRGEVRGEWAARVRDVVEQRFRAMRRDAELAGIPAPERLVATGGASRSAAMLEVAAEVFGVPVDTLELPESAALGAALLGGGSLSG